MQHLDRDQGLRLHPPMRGHNAGFRHTAHNFAYAMLAAVAVLGIGAEARAMSSCTGSYSAALFQPLSQPTVVGLDLRDSTPVNASLGQSFTSGMQQAGVQVNGQATSRISLTWQITGQGDNSSGGGALNTGGGNTGWSSWSGGIGASMQGGETAALPDFPRSDLFAPQQPAQSALLMLRAEVRNAATGTIEWIATIQCTMQSVDNATLAYQIGYLIGGTIGKRVDNAPV